LVRAFLNTGLSSDGPGGDRLRDLRADPAGDVTDAAQRFPNGVRVPAGTTILFTTWLETGWTDSRPGTLSIRHEAAWQAWRGRVPQSMAGLAVAAVALWLRLPLLLVTLSALLTTTAVVRAI
jgi:hypothetical protein